MMGTENNMKAIKIGWAQTNLTPDRPVQMIGQMYHRVSEYVRDPITATALALDNGEAQAVFVSLDMTEVPMHAAALLRERLAGVEGLSFDMISFGVTHTHSSSDFYADFMRLDNESVFGADLLPKVEMGPSVLHGEEAQAYFAERVADVIARAWQARKPGGVSAAHDYAAAGFSRRAVFRGEGGDKTVMYGDCSQESFVRFEPGGDSSVDLLYTWDMEGRLTGVAVNVPCPSQVFELHRFLSADYWGFVRNDVRERLGNVFVLPLCGAAGDLAPLDLVRISRDNKEALRLWGGQTQEVFRNFDMTRECEAISARITDAVVRGYKYARNYIDMTPALMHEILRLALPLRLVSKEEYEVAAAEVERIKETFSAGHRMENADVVSAFEPQGDVLRWRMQQETTTFPCVSHIVRIANVALATNPFELFSEYALRMKARVLPEQLFVVQLSNGVGGYLPSESAIAGGSYSSKSASTFCGPAGGDALVEATISAVNGMFSK